MVQRTLSTTFLISACIAASACQRAKQTALPPEPLQIRYGIGGMWNPGYSLEVSYDKVVVESPHCRMAKSAPRGDGFCVIRISSKQWHDFKKAIEPYRRSSVLFDPSKVVDEPYTRPDGKPCAVSSTDANLIGITWYFPDGVRFAQFYEGCDEEELASFYARVERAPTVLPINGVIQEH